MREIWSRPDQANLLAQRHLGLVSNDSELLLSSSHGRPFSAATFQRLDARTGEVLATAKLRDDVRCWSSVGNGTLYAATSRQLFRLDDRTLKTQVKMRKGVPGYCNYIVKHEDVLVLGGPNEVVFYKGESQRPTKRRAQHLVGLFDAGQDKGLFAFCGNQGKVLGIRNASARPTLQFEAAPFSAAAVRRDHNQILLLRTGTLDRYRYTDSGWARESLAVDRAFNHCKLENGCSWCTLAGQNSSLCLDLHGSHLTEVEAVALPSGLNLVEISFESRLLYAWEPEGDGIRLRAYDF